MSLTKIELSKYVGSKIKHYRESRNMTQDELADKLGDTTRQTVSRYETGERKANQDVLFKLVDIFNIKLDDLFPPRYSQEDTQVPQIRETESIFEVSDFISEVQRATKDFTKSEKDKVLSYIYDIKSDKQREMDEGTSILELAISLSSTNIQVIDNLSSYIVRVINNGDQVFEDAEMLLKDCKVAVDQNRTSTIEFVNTKRKIYEFLLPLAALANAYDQGIVSIKDLSEAFKFTREFILEVIIYHANTKGSIVEYDGYIFDFSSIPVEFSNINELDSIEINVKDTNEKRNKLHNKKMAKKKTR